jgi:hypothetical protein
MRTAFILICALLVACSPSGTSGNETNDQVNGQASPSDLHAFSGRLFSDLVQAYPEFRVSERAISADALAAFSEADGIQTPGELHKFRGRDLLVFLTCRKDHCSEATNLIVVDPVTHNLNIVHQDSGKTTIVVDGPPDVTKLIRTACTIDSCNWETEAPVADKAYP